MDLTIIVTRKMISVQVDTNGDRYLLILRVLMTAVPGSSCLLLLLLMVIGVVMSALAVSGVDITNAHRAMNRSSINYCTYTSL